MFWYKKLEGIERKIKNKKDDISFILIAKRRGVKWRERIGGMKLLFIFSPPIIEGFWRKINLSSLPYLSFTSPSFYLFPFPPNNISKHSVNKLGFTYLVFGYTRRRKWCEKKWRKTKCRHEKCFSPVTPSIYSCKDNYEKFYPSNLQYLPPFPPVIPLFYQHEWLSVPLFPSPSFAFISSNPKTRLVIRDLFFLSNDKGPTLKKY